MKAELRNRLIADYKEAYRQANGKEANVTAKRDIVTIHQTGAMPDLTYHIADIMTMTDNLRKRQTIAQHMQQKLASGLEQVYVALSNTNGFKWVTFQAREQDATAEQTGYVAVTQGFGTAAEAEELAASLNAQFKLGA